MDHTATPPRPLHRQRDFVMLWAGQSVSALGTHVTGVALPLTAIATLHAGPGTLGLLDAMLWLPFLLLALLVGAYVDRLPGRPLLVAADTGRAFVLAAIVWMGWSDLLTVPLLAGLVFLLGVLTVVFEVTYLAYVPSLVPAEQLVGANSRLQASASVGQVGGPALGGVLVQLLSATTALLADAVSYLASVAGLLAIRARQVPAPPPASGVGIVARIREGLQITYRNRYLRALVGVAGSYNLFDQWILTLFQCTTFSSPCDLTW